MVLGATEYLEPRIMAGLRLVGAVCMVLWLQEAVGGGGSSSGSNASDGSEVPAPSHEPMETAKGLAEPAVSEVPETMGAAAAAVPAAAPEAAETVSRR